MSNIFKTAICGIAILGASLLVPSTMANELKDKALPFLHTHGMTRFDNVSSFNPRANITREQAAHMATVFAKKFAGVSADTSKACSFADMNTADTTLRQSILDACRFGVFKGMKRGNKTFFNPRGLLTRADAFVILMRMKYGFLDESGGAYRKMYFEKAKLLGITKETSHVGQNKRYITRGEFGLLLYRFYTVQRSPSGSTRTSPSPQNNKTNTQQKNTQQSQGQKNNNQSTPSKTQSQQTQRETGSTTKTNTVRDQTVSATTDNQPIKLPHAIDMTSVASIKHASSLMHSQREQEKDPYCRDVLVTPFDFAIYFDDLDYTQYIRYDQKAGDVVMQDITCQMNEGGMKVKVLCNNGTDQVSDRTQLSPTQKEFTYKGCPYARKSNDARYLFAPFCDYKQRGERPCFSTLMVSEGHVDCTDQTFAPVCVRHEKDPNVLISARNTCYGEKIGTVMHSGMCQKTYADLVAKQLAYDRTTKILTAQVCNEGKKDVSDAAIKVEVCGGGSCQMIYSENTPLNVNNCRDISVSDVVNHLSSNTKKISLTAQTSDHEKDRTNNTKEIPYPPNTPAQKIDLSIKSVVFGDRDDTTGQVRPQLKFDICTTAGDNIGINTALSKSVAYRLTSGERKMVGSVKPIKGGCVTVTLDTLRELSQVFGGPGTRDLKIEIDIENAYDETDETNNIKQTSGRIHTAGGCSDAYEPVCGIGPACPEGHSGYCIQSMVKKTHNSLCYLRGENNTMFLHNGECKDGVSTQSR